MRILLDENFPLALRHNLRKDGLQTEHIITIGWRGATDQRIREQLLDRSVLFLTQDEDFLLGKPVAATVVVSRLKQSRVWQSESKPGAGRSTSSVPSHVRNCFSN